MMDSRLGAIGGQSHDGYETYPDVDALQYMGRSPPGSVQEYPVRPEDSVSMTARHARGGSNIASGRPTVIFENPSEESEAPSPQSHGVLYNWRWEMVHACLAVGAIGGIFTLLYEHNGCPVTQWTHSISINTVLSILVVIIMACVWTISSRCIGQLKFSWYKRRGQPVYDIVRLDQASHGYCELLRLIFSIHPVHMASATAVLLLLSCIIGPFVQQAISIKHQCVQAATTSFRPVAIYEVEWRWLVLPAVIVGLAVLILAIMMCRTRRECIWKSSTLALISLGAQVERQIGQSTSMRQSGIAYSEDIRGIDKNVKVQLDADGRWHVVRDA